MPNKAIELAQLLGNYDVGECPFCDGEKHEKTCPFAIACAILDALYDEIIKRLLPEANKMSLKWIEVYNLDDGEQWHDVEIEHNPDSEGG